MGVRRAKALGRAYERRWAGILSNLWFGVFMVLQCELSLLSPPVGMTLYVIQAVRREGNIKDVFAGTIPFVAAMVLMTAILIHAPVIATWLPKLMFGPN